MTSVTGKPVRRSSYRRLALGLAVGTLAATATVGACAIPNETDKTKAMLTEYGTIVHEWEIRDDANKKTLTYVLMRNKKNTYEAHEIAATDGKRVVDRNQVGGIDSNGCFLYAHGVSSLWITQLGEKVKMGDASDKRTKTECLEYKDTPAWTYVPEKERKAAEPPPPPPKPDAGSADGGGADGGAKTDAGSGEAPPL